MRFMALPEAERLRALRASSNSTSTPRKSKYAAAIFTAPHGDVRRKAHKAVLCDIDFYREAPFTNEMGRMWGSH